MNDGGGNITGLPHNHRSNHRSGPQDPEVGHTMKATQVSTEILKEFDQFLNHRLQRTTLEELYKYVENRGEYPTTCELVQYIGNHSYSNIQPRISQLSSKMLVTEAGKRSCNCSLDRCQINRAITTWKPVIQDPKENQSALLVDQDTGDVIAE